MRIERFEFRDFEVAGSVVPARKASATARRKEEPPAPPPAPSFSEEELKAAERESYKKGFLEGTEEGRRQAESEQALVQRQLTENTEKFMGALAPLLNDYRQLRQQMRADLPKVALAIARKVAGNALAENAQAVVHEVAAACVESMIEEPKLVITVHPSLAETLEGSIKTLAQRMQHAAHVTVAGNEAMAVSDCRIEWKYGAMERHTGQLWEQVEKVVESMVTSAKRETDAHIEQLTQQLPKE